MKTSKFFIACVFGLYLLLLAEANAQDLEPRRWTVLPAGINVVGAAYGRTDGDLYFDPVLQLEDVEFDGDSLVLSYVRSFSLAGRSARFDAIVPWQNFHWEGLLEGEPASTARVGLADPRFRLSVILAGGSAATPGKPQQQMATRPANTVVGAAIEVTVPWGEHFEDKLLNLGRNRFIFRPQIGAVHTRGPWSYELTGSTFFYTENDDFFGGSRLEQDPLYAIQAHIIRVFRPGVWASVSAGYGWGGHNTLDGVESDDKKSNVLAAVSLGFPVGRKQGVKIAYIRSETREFTGSDSNTLAIGWTYRY